MRRRFVCSLVSHHAFVKIAENGVMQDGDASYVVYTALFNDAKVAKMV